VRLDHLLSKEQLANVSDSSDPFGNVRSVSRFWSAH
jgi:hypothetical protein